LGLVVLGFWPFSFHNNPFHEKGMPGIQTTNFPLKDSTPCENYVSKWESSPSKGETATQDAETYTKGSRKINCLNHSRFEPNLANVFLPDFQWKAHVFGTSIIQPQIQYQNIQKLKLCLPVLSES